MYIYIYVYIYIYIYVMMMPRQKQQGHSPQLSNFRFNVTSLDYRETTTKELGPLLQN